MEQTNMYVCMYSKKCIPPNDLCSNSYSDLFINAIANCMSSIIYLVLLLRVFKCVCKQCFFLNLILIYENHKSSE